MDFINKGLVSPSSFLILIIALCSPNISIASTPINGVHYKEISTNLALSQYDFVQFFSFSCHHCFRFEMETNSLSSITKNYTKIKKIPVSFGKEELEKYAKLYLTLEHLGIEDTYYKKIFEDIHIYRNKEFDLQGICERLNMSPTLTKQVKHLYHSKTIRSIFEKTQEIIEQYGISGVPALAIENKYVTNAAMTRGTKKLYAITRYLSGQ